MHSDLYLSGLHLPDVLVFGPAFRDDALLGLVGTIAHHVDVGGAVPGRLSPNATEIFQEGI
jgi:N-methylhydantoinase B